MSCRSAVAIPSTRRSCKCRTNCPYSSGVGAKPAAAIFSLASWMAMLRSAGLKSCDAASPDPESAAGPLNAANRPRCCRSDIARNTRSSDRSSGVRACSRGFGIGHVSATSRTWLACAASPNSNSSTPQSKARLIGASLSNAGVSRSFSHAETADFVTPNVSARSSWVKPFASRADLSLAPKVVTCAVSPYPRCTVYGCA